MARDIIINGESLVRVKFGAHVNDPWINPFYPDYPTTALGDVTPAFAGTTIYNLGLAIGSIKVSPKYSHHDIHPDDFGPEVPAEVLSNLMEASIHMTFVHWDIDVMRFCLAEAHGGERIAGFLGEGVMKGCGIPLGGGKRIWESGNHYVTLAILSEQLGLPWRFPTTYIMGNAILPLGTKRSLLDVTWRAIPYVAPFLRVPTNTYPDYPNDYVPGGGGPGVSELSSEYASSAGSVVWDHEPVED